MGYSFNADEIFDIACRMEENGVHFYEKMSKKISDAQIKKMLRNLAAMEKAHKNMFELMRKDLSAVEKENTVFDPEGETANYLKAMADIHIFDQKAEDRFDLHEDLTEKAKLSKVLRSAINLEWASISLYMGLKDFVPENMGKTKIDRIIKEEMRHVSILSDRLMTVHT